MRKLIYIILLMIVCSQVRATNYYVDSLGGNDANTGLKVGSVISAWKTVNKVNIEWSASTFTGGDSILFNRGYRYVGELIPAESGASKSSNIIVAAYGSGALPIITGFVPLTFTRLGASNNWASQALTLSTVNMVARNDVPIRIARYPNIDDDSTGYLAYHLNSYSDGAGGVIRRANNAAIGITTYTNNSSARIYTRNANWAMDWYTITNHTSTTVTFAGNSTYANDPYEPEGNNNSTHFGFWLQDDSVFLDQNDEWWQSTKTTGTTANRIIYYWTGGVAPTGVKASTVTTLLNVGAFQFITFYNLKFEGSSGDMITLLNNAGSDINFKNCSFNCAGRNTFDIGHRTTKGADDVLIDNCTITNTQNTGIFSYTNRTVIQNTSLTNTGMWPGMGDNEIDFSYAGIEVKGNHSTISNVTIVATGGTPINTRKDDGNFDTIRNCLIDGFGYFKKDLGGIYYFGKGNAANGNTNSGRYCVHNIVRNAIGGTDGSQQPQNKDVYALYCDQETSGLVALYNTFYNSARGVLINPASHDIRIDSNLLYNNSYHQMYISLGNASDASVSNLHIQKNIYYSTSASQEIAQYITITWNLDVIGANVDNNYYVSPLNSATGALLIDTSANGGLSGTTSLPAWKAFHPSDAHSTLTPYSYANDAVRLSKEVFLVNTSGTNSPTLFPGIILTDLYGTVYSESITVPPHSSILAFKTGTTITPPPPPPPDTNGFSPDVELEGIKIIVY